jgi:hypothetical protein
MPLCTPSVGGSVSELSTSLRIQGALPEATVLVVSVGENRLIKSNCKEK